MRIRTPTATLVWLALMSGCAPGLPEFCADRDDDGDCDGVPDLYDQCPGTDFETLTDARGCSASERAGCSATLKTPVEREKLDPTRQVVFRWSGDCDLYLVQLSTTPAFLPGDTFTAARVVELQAQTDVRDDMPYWRVVGGLEGREAGYSTPAREIRWK